MIMILISALCFAIGALCFYVPLKNLKKRLQNIIPSVAKNAPSVSSLDEVYMVKNHIHTLEQKNKKLLEKQSLYKQTSYEIYSVVKECILILDKKGKVLFHNPQSQKIFYLPKTISVGIELNEIIRSTDVIELFKECITKQSRIAKECSFRKKNQHIKSLFQVTALPFILDKENPDVQNVILVFDDQTTIKETRQAHIDFVSNVSHELKTPLTALQGYVEMLIQDFAKKKLDQFDNFLSILLRNCKRMNNLVNDLLSLSNLISSANIEKQKISTKELTQKVIQNLKPKDRKFHFSFSANYVVGHPQWVETVLHNLVDNACQHTPEKSDVHILWEQEPNQVLLKVRDTGDGIPEKYHQRVFERFFRIDASRSRRKGGTGVGLSLVQQALAKHGGSVQVVSSPTRGAEFICTFPTTNHDPLLAPKVRGELGETTTTNPKAPSTSPT